MEQEVTFQEALRIIRTDRTSFQGYSKQGALTKREVYTYHLNILGREGYACEGRHAEGDQQEKDLAGWWGSVLAHRSREFKDHLPKKQRSEHRQIVLG